MVSTYYVAYTGDRCEGVFQSLHEVARWFGVSRKTVEFWASPTNVKRKRGARAHVVMKVEIENE